MEKELSAGFHDEINLARRPLSAKPPLLPPQVALVLILRSALLLFASTAGSFYGALLKLFRQGGGVHCILPSSLGASRRGPSRLAHLPFFDAE